MEKWFAVKFTKKSFKEYEELDGAIDNLDEELKRKILDEYVHGRI